MGLIKGILIFLIVYYTLRFIFKLIAPLLIKNFISKVQRKSRPNEPRKQEGEISIKKNNKSSDKKSSSNVGEYIDFEEIDDNQ